MQHFIRIYTEMPTIHNFCGIIPIFKPDFRITISSVKITANNNYKMVPNKIQTGLCIIYWKNVNLEGKKLRVEEPACDTKQNGKKTLCGCRNSSDYTNLWPLLKPIEGWKILCMK